MSNAVFQIKQILLHSQVLVNYVWKNKMKIKQTNSKHFIKLIPQSHLCENILMTEVYHNKYAISQFFL